MEGHLIVRDTAPDPTRASVFAGVIETTLQAPPRVQAIGPVSVAPGQEAAWEERAGVAIQVLCSEIGSVNTATGSFATATPIMKLRVNPRLFDGKHLLAAGAAAAQRLLTANEDAFVLATPAGIADFATGGQFTVFDLGVDDHIEIVPHGELR